jgi:hypothetical protein
MTNNFVIERDNECNNQPYDRRIGLTPQLSMKAGTTNNARYPMSQAIATNNCNNHLGKKGTYTHKHLAGDCGSIFWG